MLSDEALMQAFQRGSREAFEELFARYRQPLYGYLRRRLDNRERAEDLAQETFLAVIRSAKRYQPRALVRTWLYGIAMNLLMAERRRVAKDGSAAGAESATLDSPDEGLWVREALARARMALKSKLTEIRRREHQSFHAGLLEMVIGGECLGQAPPLHDYHGKAISEAPLFVAAAPV